MGMSWKLSSRVGVQVVKRSNDREGCARNKKGFKGMSSMPLSTTLSLTIIVGQDSCTYDMELSYRALSMHRAGLSRGL